MEQISRANWWQPRTAEAVVERPVAGAPPRERAPRLPFLALSAFTVVLVVSPQDLVPSLAPLRLALVAAVAAVASQLGSSAGRAQALAARAPQFAIAAALVVWIILTLPLSYWPGGSVATFSDRLMKSVIVFWLIGVTVITLPRLRGVFWLLSVLTIPIAITALRNYATGVVDPDAGNRIVGYGSGLAANPNDLALMLDIVLPLTLVLAVSARRAAARAVAVFIATIDVAAVIVTFSRGGFVAMLAVLALFLFRQFRQWPLSVGALVIVGVIAAVPLAPRGFSDRLATMADVNSDPTGSAQDRWRDTVLAVKYVAANPVFGAGLGNDILVLNALRGPTWRSVHNTYLNYGVDLGVPGMLLFLALLITSIRGARQRERHHVDSVAGRELSVLAGGIVVGLWGFAVAAFFYPVAYQFYFYYLAGLAVAAQRLDVGEASGAFAS